MYRADIPQDKSFRLYKVLSGTVIVLALLTAFEVEALTEWRAMGIIAITLAASAFAEAFARTLADEIVTKRRVSARQAWAVLRGSMLVLLPGVVLPLALIAVSAGWLSAGIAFAVACWTLVLVLFVSGYAACALRGAGVWRGLAYGLASSGFGLGIVALRGFGP